MISDACCRQEDDVVALMELAVNKFGSLDCVVSIAGLMQPVADANMSKTNTSTSSEFDVILNINSRGVFLGMLHGARSVHSEPSTLRSTAQLASAMAQDPPKLWTARYCKVGFQKPRPRPYVTFESEQTSVVQGDETAWRQGIYCEHGLDSRCA